MENEKKICRFYLRNGSCKFGDSCHFTHARSREVVQMAEEKINRVGHPACIYFIRNGSCRYGSACKFRHHVAITPVTLKVEKCKYRFASWNRETGEPTGNCRSGDHCRFRHKLTEEERMEFRRRYQQRLEKQRQQDQLKQQQQIQNFRMLGWSLWHESVFRGDYKQVYDIMKETEGLNKLLAQKTTKPYVINWSEYDSVDRCFDDYKITIPVGSTAMDVALTSASHLDKDSPSKIAVVENLRGSHSGGISREIIIKMLEYPHHAKQILELVSQKGPHEIRRFIPA
jgi:hypothetical protein